MNIKSIDQIDHWNVHLQHNHPYVVVEARGETTPEEEEEVIPEEDAAEVLQMSLVEERIRIRFNQVVRGLTNKKFNVIIVRNLVIMHINAGRSSTTKEGKAKTSRATPTLHRAQCCWHVNPQLSAMLSKKFQVTYGI